MNRSRTQPRASAKAAIALATACGLAAPAPHAAAQLTDPFPATFPLRTLDPGQGGDGTKGFVIRGTEPLDLAGFSVASAGDVNGDGIDDAIIGAPGYSYYDYYYGRWTYKMAGRSYILFGRDSSSGAGFPARVELGAMVAGEGVRFDGEETDSAGWAVAPIGDFNGDGIDDVAVGASSSSDCYVVFGRGSSSPFPASMRLTELDGVDGFRLSGTPDPWPDGDGVGSAVAAADINGDGLPDLLIGARYVRDGGTAGPGEVLVHFGRRAAAFPPAASAHAVDGENGFRIVGIDRHDRTGRDVANAGDVNGDGVDDIIIGAPNASPGGLLNAGACFVVFGRAGGGFGDRLDLAELDGSNGFRLNGGRYRDRTGASVAAAGDVNGDGIDDMVIGALGAATHGRAYIVFGRDSRMGQTFPVAIALAELDGARGLRIDGLAHGISLAHDVAAAGDVNSDGVDDVLIAGHNAYIVFGLDTTSGPGFPAALDVSFFDGSQGFRLEAGAWAVASPGDVNHDGVSDIIVGAAHVVEPGTAYILYGRMVGAPCYADCDGSGQLDFFDFLCFQNQFAASDPRADCDESGELDFFDFLCFQNAFAAGCP